MTTIEIDLDTIDMTPEPMRPTFKPCTDKQVQFIARLVAERVIEGQVAEQVTDARTKVMGQRLSSREASDLIDTLLRAPKSKAGEVFVPVTPGMYRTPDGTIYKVQESPTSGRLYAKRLEIIEPLCGGCVNDDPCDDPCEWGTEFVYAPGAMRVLRDEHRMTLEQAKEFGALYGTCCVCGRTLTNEASIEAGIGPVCAEKF